MTMEWIQLAFNEFFIVLFDVSHLCQSFIIENYKYYSWLLLADGDFCIVEFSTLTMSLRFLRRDVARCSLTVLLGETVLHVPLSLYLSSAGP